MSKRRSATTKRLRILEKKPYDSASLQKTPPATEDNVAAPPEKPFKPRRLPLPRTLWTDSMSYFPITHGLGITLALARQSDEWVTNEFTRFRFAAFQHAKDDKWSMMAYAEMPAKGSKIPFETSSPILGVFSNMNRAETGQVMLELHKGGVRTALYNRAANAELETPAQARAKKPIDGKTPEERLISHKANQLEEEMKRAAAEAFANMTPGQKSAFTRTANKKKAEEKRVAHNASQKAYRERLKMKKAIEQAGAQALAEFAVDPELDIEDGGITVEGTTTISMESADKNIPIDDIKEATADDMDVPYDENEPDDDIEKNTMRPLLHKIPRMNKRLALGAYNFDYLNELDPVTDKAEWEQYFPIPKMMTTQEIHRMPIEAISQMREEEEPEGFGATTETFGNDGSGSPIFSSAAIYHSDEGYNGEEDRYDEEDDDDDWEGEEWKEAYRRKQDPVSFDDIDPHIMCRGLDDATANMLMEAANECVNMPMGYIAVRVTFTGIRLKEGEEPPKPETIEAVGTKAGKAKNGKIKKDKKEEVKPPETEEPQHTEDVWYLYSLERTGLVPMMLVIEPRPAPPVKAADAAADTIKDIVTETVVPETPDDIRMRSFKQMQRVARILRNLENHDIRRINNNDVYHRFIDNEYSLHWAKFMPLIRKVIYPQTPPETPGAVSPVPVIQ
jgi:hypothetical protein